MGAVILAFFGAVLVFDVAIGCAWWTLRRANRRAGVVNRVRPYVGQRRWPW